VTGTGGLGGALGPLAGAIGISGGPGHVCAVLSDGEVACWGEDGSGELGTLSDRCGNINQDCSNVPVLVTGLSDATAVAAGGQHTCALVSGGAVACWGDNSAGQLGSTAGGSGSNVSSTFTSVPVPVPGLSGVKQIAAGYKHTCALLATGGVVCWGDNSSGELGDGTMTSSHTPVTVVDAGSSPLTGVKAVSAGEYFSCAVLRDSSVACWGDASPADGGTHAGPVAVMGATNAVTIATNQAKSCIVRADGSVFCWGLLSQPTDQTQIAGLTGATAVAPANTMACALAAGGSVDCWGAWPSGPENTATPVAGLSGVTGIAVTASVACAIKPGGAVVCWGFGLDGNLGDGSFSNASTPVAAQAPAPPPARPANCSPCNLTLAAIIQNCSPSPSATCVEQTSMMTAADGTRTVLDNKCYADGTKSLTTQISTPADGGASGSGSVTSQLLKGGSLCASGQSSSGAPNETLRDSSGSLVATIATTTTSNGDGGVTQTQTITCAGGSPEPLVNGCAPSSSTQGCVMGSCM
jgi:alpha-tubulin suppressor-like RCC1 family protein